MVVDKKDDTHIPEVIPDVIAGRRTLFVGAGTVNAYVDLSGLVKDDLKLSEDGKSVTIRLPAPKLEKPNLDPSRTRLAAQERGLIDQLKEVLAVQDQARFYKMAEEKITAAAEKTELKKRAAENTKTMLTGMFGPLGLQATFL